jgi:threonine dehydrogenase-like Zn-dependent dehydrogenase
MGFVDQINAGRCDIFQNELQEGDLIIWNRGVSCKSCYNCLIKRKNYTCSSRWTYGFSKSINDYPYLNGSYASHMLLTPETEIIRIHKAEDVQPEADYIPYASACCAGTTTACVFEQIRIEASDNVVIQGPGPLGVYAALFAKEAGAQNIIVIGGTKERLDLCLEAGATHIINRKDTTEEERLAKVLEYTEGRGGDVVLELAGTREAVEEGVRYTATNGTYASAGIAVDVGDVKINWFRDVVRKNVTIKGVWVGDVKNTWQAMKMYEKYKALLAKMISHRIPLKEADQALRMMEEKQVIKAVLIP